MEVLYRRVAGVDVSKSDAKVCVRVLAQGRSRATSTVSTWSARTPRILELREHLLDQGVECVVMEATGDYWKPFYYLFEDAGFELILANPSAVKNVPGRKSDVSDARWLAQLAAHGLVRASLVPPPPIRRLRDLTRTRTHLTRDRTREIQRLEGLLEDAGVKLSSVASTTLSVSGRAMLEALIAGERDPEVLADLARARLRLKIPQLREALVGRFTDHHARLARIHLTLIDSLDAGIAELTAQIEVEMEPFRGFHDLICTIPGIAETVADVVVAETGADMSKFPSAHHLASWAGTAPGSYESAGKQKKGTARPGNGYLQGALGIAAFVIARNHHTQLGARYRRLAARRGPNVAAVATMRTLLVIIWHMTQTGEVFRELGSDYYASRDPDRARKRAVHQLEALGYDVTLMPAHEPQSVPG
jgi:transposase